ncbi:ATP-binding protein [Oleiharenicola lentus]|uniref:ATP-binding protein n=1 Tax=Oleiharenicola lentus TaxID=2508720 RepID=UPI003F67CFD4
MVRHAAGDAMSDAKDIRYDLTNCDREPIHIPGNIQPHGFLVAAPVETMRISHASENVPFGMGARALLGFSLQDFLGVEMRAALHQAVSGAGAMARPIALPSAWSQIGHDRNFELIVHVRNGFVILEGEELSCDNHELGRENYHQIKPLLANMDGVESLNDLYRLVTDEMRKLTDFDRVLIYQFDELWNGSVIAESRNEKLPSYLGHRFPATDIPKPARDLYLINRLRLIASNDYTPVKILAASAELPPLDMSIGTLRGVSPIHLEYMRNMGTGCSMSVALMRGGKLWGLLSCHCHEPRQVTFATRTLCDLLGHILSLQLATREQAWELGGQVELRGILSRLVTQMTKDEDFVAALNNDDLIKLTNAHGVAIVRGEEVRAAGKVPTNETVLKLRDWVTSRCEHGLFWTDALPSRFALNETEAALCGGLLAISISPTERSYVLWFRAELVQTVLWGGDPHKDLPPPGSDMQIHPRKSFDSWKETVRGRSARWLPTELDAAMGFRRAVIDVVLKKAAEKAILLTELQRMNRELEAFSYTVSHDLRAPFRHVRGYAELLQMEKGNQLDEEGRQFLAKILSAADYAGTLVDTMLTFSQMSMTGLKHQPVNLDAVVARARTHGEMQAKGRQIEWRVSTLPEVIGDAGLLQVVFQNLLDNAVKYTGKREQAVITISSEEKPEEWVVSIADNGAGFDMAYANKLFGIFQRLHSNEQFSGLGIGLATVRRIIERHGGRIWASSELGAGATFSFSIPKTPPLVTSYKHA